ncbi:MAG: hypothetical protein MUO61_05390 [Dehalococcoidia bacterium]|jgi:3-hydroxyacyl-[acyl-carrier-protein] dehydratase|nr:hypothetical protein [Dehalococcoidia bacterium]
MRNEVFNALKSVSLDAENRILHAVFWFDPSLPVFKGHFPGNPILPGVFLIEMVRTAWATVTKKRCNIVKICKAKFAGIILPGQDISVNATVTSTDDYISINAVLQTEQTTKTSISLELKTDVT